MSKDTENKEVEYYDENTDIKEIDAEIIRISKILKDSIELLEKLNNYQGKYKDDDDGKDVSVS